MSEDQEWSRRVLLAGLRHRLRARGGRVPLAHLLRRRRDATVLRLGRVGRALVRRRRRAVQGGALEGGRPLRAGRDRRGSGRRASGAGSRTRRSTSSRSSPAFSSGDGIAFFPRHSSRVSAPIPSTGKRRLQRAVSCDAQLWVADAARRSDRATRPQRRATRKPSRSLPRRGPSAATLEARFERGDRRCIQRAERRGEGLRSEVVSDDPTAVVGVRAEPSRATGRRQEQGEPARIRRTCSEAHTVG